MTLPLALSREKEIAQIVSAAEAELRPNVERIRWEIGQDWTWDWAILVRVVLSNAASRGKRLIKTTREVRTYLRDRLRTDDLSLFPYVEFRSQAEVVQLRDKAWI